jgi:hypothetical protein
MSRTGRPAGDAAFVRLVERLTARDLSKGKPGRQLKTANKLVLFPRNSTISIKLTSKVIKKGNAFWE